MNEAQTTQPIAVYQLAKELGIDTMSLLDKLNNELKLKVKNHMTELAPEQVVFIKNSLVKKGESTVAAKKAVTTKPRKKAEATATQTEVSPAKPSSSTASKTATAQKTITKPAAKSTAAASTPTTAATAASLQAAAAAEAAKSAPIIRRRTKSDGEIETVLPPQHGNASTQAADAAKAAAQAVAEAHAAHKAAVKEALAAFATQSAEAEEEAAPIEDASSAETTESTEAPVEAASIETPLPAEEETIAMTPVTAQTIDPVSNSIPAVQKNILKTVLNKSATAQQPSAPKSTETAVTAKSPVATAATPVKPLLQKGAPTLVAASSPIAPTAAVSAIKAKSPIVLPPRPVAPRRSILKIVELTAPPQKPMTKPVDAPAAKKSDKPSMKGTSTLDKDGFRIVRMTKENLDQMVEEENARKRGGLRERELDIRPEDVKFADYRKKEMVFLPKKKKLPVGKELKRTQITVAKASKRVIEMGDSIAVSDLAAQLSVKATDVIRKLMGMGMMATINQSIDFDTTSLIATEYQFEVKNIAFKEDTIIQTEITDAEETLNPRPPVVTVMGHVDHGKTSLLDAIRSAKVAAGEAGGITQHIGAYTVEIQKKLITFIDTPGHEAFTVMRARGANATDIVILVVAADDGVMPQTREALNHAKAAGVPIIVAVNKMDKPGANPEKVKQVLAEMDLLSEDWGGQTMFVPVSAIKHTNIDKLLEAILLQAEVLDLKANADCLAHGTVLEARLEKGRGPMASVLVRRGTLKVGDAIVSGTTIGRVKAMMDDKGRNVKTVLPGMAAEVLGFEGVPSAGERFDATVKDTDAQKIAEHRREQIRAKAAAPAAKLSLEDLFSKIQTGETKELNVILKADVFGSVEAIRDSLVKASTEKVKVKVIHSATGGITESDVLLATASNALIIGFNVRPETKARLTAEAEHIEIKCYNIIYELLDDIKNSMVGLLDKKKVEKYLGRAEVRQIFTVPKIGVIAGAAVVDGKIIRGASVRLLRESRIIFDGKMSSLRRFKDDAKEVAQGYECGISIDGYNDLKPGDLIEAYTVELITPELQ